MKTLMLDSDARGVVRLTLNRPQVHNAFNETMIAELHETFDALGQQAGVRAIVLTGAGASFSAGADVTWMRRAADMDEAANRADALRMADMFACMNACPRPVIGLVNGAAFGGGVGLVACCDIVIAHPQAVFGLTEVRLGLIPAVIAPFVIARTGAGAARRYMLTGERFDAATARRIGLVHEVMDAPDAAPVLDALLQGAPGAVAEAKALIHDVSRHAPGDDLRHLTARRIAARRVSDEGRAGVDAFLARRKPDWGM